MMELPILAPAPVVIAHARVFRDLCDNPCQFRHFQHDLTGLIVLPNESLAHMARCLMESTDKTNLSRVLAEAPWRADEVNRRRIRVMLQQTTPPRQRRRESMVAIDDTLCEHVGSLFDDVDRHDNHRDGTYPLAHNPVTSFYVSGPVRFPLGLRLYRRDEELTQWEAWVAKHVPDLTIPRDTKGRNRLHQQVDPMWLQYPECLARHEECRTTIARAVELIEEAMGHKVPFGVVVFDAWYVAEELVRVLVRRRKDWISVLKTNRSNWASVTAFGASTNDFVDDSAAIQAAIDSGKPIIYFPSPVGDPSVQRVYRIDQTIIIRNNVQQILGLDATIELGPTLRAASSPVFRVEKVSGNLVVFDEMLFDSEGGTQPVFFEHRSPDTVVIRHSNLGGGARSYRGIPSAGKLFLEDVSGKQWEFASGQQVWARQFNPESPFNPKVLNTGATVWLLGVKTEHAMTLIETREGGTTEVLGATVGWGSTTSAPLFINNGENFTASYFKHGSGSYTVHVPETRNGKTRELLESQLPNSKYIPLYTGYEAESTPSIPAPTRLRRVWE